MTFEQFAILMSEDLRFDSIVCIACCVVYMVFICLVFDGGVCHSIRHFLHGNGKSNSTLLRMIHKNASRIMLIFWPFSFSSISMFLSFFCCRWDEDSFHIYIRIEWIYWIIGRHLGQRQPSSFQLNMVFLPVFWYWFGNDFAICLSHIITNGEALQVNIMIVCVVRIT